MNPNVDPNTDDAATRERPISRAAIVLNVADVIEAGRKAYLEGRLSAQGPTPLCAYRDQSGRPCIIGAALTDECARSFDAEVETAIDDLVEAGLVETDDCRTLAGLQGAHDLWAGGKEAGHRRLLKMLGLPADGPGHCTGSITDASPASGTTPSPFPERGVES